MRRSASLVARWQINAARMSSWPVRSMKSRVLNGSEPHRRSRRAGGRGSASPVRRPDHQLRPLNPLAEFAPAHRLALLYRPKQQSADADHYEAFRTSQLHSPNDRHAELLCRKPGRSGALCMTYDDPDLMPADLRDVRKRLFAINSDEPTCSLQYNTALSDPDTQTIANPLGILVSSLIG
jgi:hypothetical protein